jgi:hypothetical protein
VRDGERGREREREGMKRVRMAERERERKRHRERARKRGLTKLTTLIFYNYRTEKRWREKKRER